MATNAVPANTTSGSTLATTKANQAAGQVAIAATKANLATAAALIGNPAGVENYTGRAESIGALQGICLNDATGQLGDSPGGRHMQVGVLESLTLGDPAQPSLILQIPGMWRFRWAVKPGPRSIQIFVMQFQQVAISSQLPTMTVKACSTAGISNDIIATAPASSTWTTLGPITFTATGPGVTWVELRNNYWGFFNSPCYFDHIVFK
jgi:hypothetical protein